MQLISCRDGKVLTLDAALSAGAEPFVTSLAALDALPPGGAFARGAIHELLADPAHGKPLFFALLLAAGSAGIPLDVERWTLPSTLRLSDEGSGPSLHSGPGVGVQASFSSRSHASASGVIVWCDPEESLYPPALAALGIPLERLLLLHARRAEQSWAIAECLRCKGVSAVIAAVPRLSRVETRRLQLSAERGGGVGVLLRPSADAAAPYAAATRWLVRPVPGERTVQRWSAQLIHGHGGRVGHAVVLEHCRENHLVRAIDSVADRPAAAAKRALVGARAS